MYSTYKVSYILSLTAFSYALLIYQKTYCISRPSVTIHIYSQEFFTHLLHTQCYITSYHISFHSYGHTEQYYCILQLPAEKVAFTPKVHVPQFTLQLN